MFIDYLTLMLVNTAAGLLAAGIFLWKGQDGPNPKAWATPFAMAALIALAGGLYMTFTWPITQVEMQGHVHNLRFANAAFGESSVLFGAVLLGVALSVSRGWSLMPTCLYAFLAGLTAVAIGIALGALGLTQMPFLTMAGFVLAGLGGMLSPLAVKYKSKALRMVVFLALLGSSAIWLVTAYPGYWMHLKNLSQ